MAPAVTFKVKGGPELKARLDAVSRPFRPIAGAWQYETTRRARSTAPSRTGRGRASIAPGELTDRFASVNGAFWLIFVDRGTKEHDIEPPSRSGKGRKWQTSVQPSGPESGYGKPKFLKFEYKGQTIFARKVHRKRMRRRPFITKAAQESIAPPMMGDTVIGLWNRRRAGRFTALVKPPKAA